MSEQDTSYNLYFYTPNQGAAIFFAVAFGLSTICHFWQCIKYRSFKVTALFPVSCLLFVTAFSLRAVGARSDENLGIFLAQLVLTYAAPPILELANYHVFGRVLYYVPYCSPIHPGRTLTTFGILSAMVETLNGIGAAWAYNPADPPSLHSTGQALVKASLLLQIAVLGFFLSMAGVFHIRCARLNLTPRSVRGPLLTLYLSSGLILVRCIFRTVEIFIASRTASSAAKISPIVRYEWFFYVFEAMPMFLDCLLWNLRHPMLYLPQQYKIFLERDGKTEVEGQGWEDKRPFLVTVCDPFGFFARKSDAHRKSPA